MASLLAVSPDVSALEVGQTYLELHHQLHKIVDQAMSSAGLSLARFKVLSRLKDGGTMNQATLAGLLGVAPRSVTDTVDGLERDGFVIRADDANDRRARIVEMTPSGRDALACVQAVRLKAMDDIFGTLSAQQRATLASLLTTIRVNLPSGEQL